MSQFHGPVYPQSAYAGFWRRSLAIFVDFLICSILYATVDIAWRHVVPKEWITREVAICIYFGLVLVCIAYCLLFRLTKCGTIGYRIMRIEYAFMFESRPSTMWLMFRAALPLYMARLMFPIDHFWILFDERKQAWHDKISGFYVVKRGSKQIGVQQIGQRLVNFAGVSMMVWEPVELGVPN